MAFTTIPGSGSAATTIAGSSGIDTVSIRGDFASNVFVGAQEAADVVNLSGAAARSQFTIKGGSGNDTVTFDGSSLDKSFLNGNANNDTFGSATDRAILTNSTVQGGQGTDSIFVNSANNSIVNGNKLADTINVSGVVISSSIRGGAGADALTFGNTANLTDTLVNGDKGADSITLTLQAGESGVATNSTVQGGEGSDTINAALATSSLLLAGGSEADTISGGSNQDTINGGTGADSIQGNAGVDQLSGGDGNDNFVYAATTDLFAAANSDLFDIVNGGTGVNSIAINNGGTGNTFTIAATNTFTRGTFIQKIRAYAASDEVISVTLGDAASNVGLNTIDLSADTLVDDDINVMNVSAETATGYTLIGGAGTENANGGAAGDTISGGGSADTITGNAGNDQMTGGAAADTFVQGVNSSTVASGIAGVDADISNGAAVWTFANGVDVVTDFTGGTDEIDSAAAGLAATNNLTAGVVDATKVVAGNYAVRGTWDGTAGTFTYAGNGADIMFGFATNTSLAVLAQNGTRSAILVGGAANFAAGDIV